MAFQSFNLTVYITYILLGACGKKLTLDTYEDGKGSPFCKICYGKFFGPKGFIGGTVAFNTFDEVPQQHNFVNDRNLKGIQIEQKDLPTSGTMAAAMAAYKKEAINA